MYSGERGEQTVIGWMRNPIADWTTGGWLVGLLVGSGSGWRLIMSLFGWAVVGHSMSGLTEWATQ